MRDHLRHLLAVLFATLFWSNVAGTTYDLSVWYAGTDCDGTPYYVFISDSTTCITDESCLADSSTGSSHLASLKTICTSDFKQAVQDVFGDSLYILRESFSCRDIGIGEAYFASGNCEGSAGFSEFAIASINDDGSASVKVFTEFLCPSASALYDYSVDKETLSNHLCDDSGNKWYASNDNSTGSNDSSIVTSPPTPTPTSAPRPSGLSTAAIIGIGIGSVAVIVLAILAILYCKRCPTAKSTESQLQPTASLGSAHVAFPVGDALQRQTNFSDALLRQSNGLWNDDVIVAKRIPRDKVHIQQLLSQGAYGEVYAGLFNGQQVAVKMLLPVTRTNLNHVNEFLAEAKLTASMDHPHIVSFVGVAWDSLSDLCVVLEYMDGGDLRALLNQYEQQHQLVGFNRQKIRIALQVCHALAYLHSLMPPVIHRDLKSRNVLLNRAMEAKLSDFGISRERMERTMTAGVGTSLWMAPEVMLGEWYDDKADMFSFGVLLSELDVHSLPYSNSKKMNRDSYGRQMPDTVLLQQVASGNVSVEFSSAGPTSITQLGYACVSIDPSLRPSAAEVLYRLQVVLAQEL